MTNHPHSFIQETDVLKTINRLRIDVILPMTRFAGTGSSGYKFESPLQTINASFSLCIRPMQRCPTNLPGLSRNNTMSPFFNLDRSIGSKRQISPVRINGNMLAPWEGIST
ncbi:hypothetical protein PAESOLCIP111_01579 [Paenibacillus solanacearum]|uniref:Uncharacterized protein n=1 Tax=Paenibacillus solanacearum TaxID=2048548 RepID=A0A916JY69_9BACL|nr:hypothetical protein [Paenibacillus solanacearum]CAG7613249.1 hypothetical protein PAESOLCIP111_01579 [Paenibacillus solanacearum]